MLLTAKNKPTWLDFMSSTDNVSKTQNDDELL